MSLLFPHPKDRSLFQDVLLTLSVVFVFTLSLTLTLAPAIRYHTWSVELKWQHWLGFVAWLLVFLTLRWRISIKLPTFDPFLLPIMALLCGWGLITIWRLEPSLGIRQTIWLVVSAFAFLGGLQIPTILGWFQKYKYLLLISGLSLTALTLVLGSFANRQGANLWLGCCGISIQPSEPLKLLLLVYLAAYLSDRSMREGLDIKLLFPSVILISAALAILLIQRDLGTAVIFISLYFIMIFLFSGKRRIIIVAFITILIATIFGSYLFDIINIRLTTWLNPWADPSGQSFQVVQSLLAVAAGGVFGTGFGLGSPGVVPVAYSDFIFSSISEETGLLGSIALILILAVFLVRGFQIALGAPNRYSRLLAGGITTYFVLQSILIIGGNLRLLPLTGVTLPLVSYGGSSLLTSFCAMLFLFIISSQTPEEGLQMPSTRQYLWITGGFLSLFGMIAFLCGWWSVIRTDDLLARNDNPRRWINDFYVPRGRILDRNNNPIMVTEGEPGTFERTLEYIPLSPVIGFSDYLFGQSGLEQSLDAYLRGLQGSPSSQIWTNRILYNQTPAGLDVRLSIDLNLQQLTDEWIGESNGAAILLNAQTGEILAMASHPYFDSNQITSLWEQYKQNPEAPMLNRTTQGQYPAGAVLGPLIMVKALEYNRDPQSPSQYQSLILDGKLIQCAQPLDSEIDWDLALQFGCPRAFETLLNSLSDSELESLFRQVGFNHSPEIPLPVAEAPVSFRNPNSQIDIQTTEDLLLSPLQIATAAAALSNEGTCPSPHLAMAVLTTQEGWVILPGKNPASCLHANSSQRVAEMLSVPTLPIWQYISLAYFEDQVVTWYVGGTTPDWQGTPLTLVIVLEEEAPEDVMNMGYHILANALSPD